MAIFTPDMDAVDVGFPIYDKGMYRVQITKRTPFIREVEDQPGTTRVVAGIHWGLEMYGMIDEDGEVSSTDESGKEIRGKPVSRYTLYLHSDKGWSFGKQFLMAALGYDKSEEGEFNEFWKENRELFAFSGDPGDTEEVLEENIGDGWNLPVGRFVDVFMRRNVRIVDGNQYEEQRMSSWQPVGDRVE